MPDASRLGIVASMLIIRAQDVSRLPPNQVIVSVVRGSRVFIGTVPAAARIAPTPECVAVRDSNTAPAASQRERYLRSSDTDTVALNRAIREHGGYDVAYRACYGDRVRRDPAFEKIVAQVQAIVAVLPPR